MKKKLLLTIALIGISGWLIASPYQVYVWLNQQECRNGIKMDLLNQINPVLKPTLLLTEADQSRYTKLTKALGLQSWPEERVHFSAKLCNEFQAIYSTVYVLDSTNSIQLAVPLRSLPNSLQLVNSWARPSFSLVPEQNISIPDSFALSQIVHLQYQQEYLYLLDGVFNELVALPLKPEVSAFRITPESVDVSQIYRSVFPHHPHKAYEEYLYLMEMLSQEEFMPIQLKRHYAAADTLWVLGELMVPQARISGTDSIIEVTPHPFIITILQGRPSNYQAIKLDIADYTLEDHNLFFCQKGRFYFAVAKDQWTTPKHYMAEATESAGQLLVDRLIADTLPAFFKDHIRYNFTGRYLLNDLYWFTSSPTIKDMRTGKQITFELANNDVADLMGLKTLQHKLFLCSVVRDQGLYKVLYFKDMQFWQGWIDEAGKWVTRKKVEGLSIEPKGWNSNPTYYLDSEHIIIAHTDRNVVTVYRTE